MRKLKYKMTTGHEEINFETNVIVKVIENGVLLNFAEPDNDNLGLNVRTKIVAKYDQVEIIRTGDVEMEQVMIPGESTMMSYKTENFATKMEVETTNLKLSDNCDKIEINYQLVFASDEKQECQIVMEIEQ